MRIAVDRLDLQRIAADQLGRHGLMDVGLDGSGTHEGLAEADKAFVGMQADPEQVGELADRRTVSRAVIFMKLSCRCRRQHICIRQ